MGREFVPVCVMIHTCLENREEKYVPTITCFFRLPQPTTTAFLVGKTVRFNNRFKNRIDSIRFKYLYVCIYAPQIPDIDTVKNL